MSSAAERAIAASKPAEMETIVEFSPERLKAPFLLRCAAFCIDYIVLLALPISWLIMSGLLSDTGTMTIGNTVWVLGFVLFFVDFLILPLFRGQTVGKVILGLTVLKTDGTKLDLGGVIRRNILGYFVTLLTLGIGFLIAAVNPSGRALHDLIGGTIVIRGQKTQV